jgi:hypothetical protein
MADTSRYYAYLPKGSSKESFKTATTASYNSALYGDIEPSYYPYSSSIDVKYIYASNELLDYKRYIYALKNVLNRNVVYSPHFAYSSSLGDKETQALTLVSIPSIFYGSSIQKGSVELKFFVSGTLIGKLEDSKYNGELIETTGSNTGSVAGVVLYKEGFVILTGSWNLDSSHTEIYEYVPSIGSPTTPKWIYWGSGFNNPSSSPISSSFDINFKGTNYVPTITMFAHADKGELNHSNNPTYIKYGEISEKKPLSSSVSYYEPSNVEIKNVVKYPYDYYTGSLEKETFITKIGIYDEKRNLIAVAKLAKPVRKTENRDFTFKLKLDI